MKSNLGIISFNFRRARNQDDVIGGLSRAPLKPEPQESARASFVLVQAIFDLKPVDQDVENRLVAELEK